MQPLTPKSAAWWNRQVDTLPPPFGVVFMMRVIEQMSIEETATALAIPAATVKTRLHRANEQLRTALGGAFAAILEDILPVRREALRTADRRCAGAAAT